ncbi:hypothetical protein D3C86_1779330 [compost metagenome]
MLFIVFAGDRVVAQPGFPGLGAPGCPAVSIEFGVVPIHADQCRWSTTGQRHLPGGAVDAELFVEQALAVEVRVVLQAIADGQVDAGVLMQVDHFAMGVQAQLDVRMAGVEPPQAWHQP